MQLYRALVNSFSLLVLLARNFTCIFHCVFHADGIYMFRVAGVALQLEGFQDEKYKVKKKRIQENK